MEEILHSTHNYRIYWYRTPDPSLRILVMEVTNRWTWEDGKEIMAKGNAIMGETEKPVYSIINFANPRTTLPADTFHLQQFGKLVDDDPLYEELCFFTGYAAQLIRMLVGIYTTTKRMGRHIPKYQYCYTVQEAVEHIKSHRQNAYRSTQQTKRLRLLENISNPQVVLLLSTLAFISFFVSGYSNLVRPTISWAEWIVGAFQNLGTEIIGAMITFIVIDVFVEGRKTQENLLEQIRTGDSKSSESALKRFFDRGFSVKKKDLQLANLKEANLKGLDLSQADLRGAQLSGAKMELVDLREAELRKANLDKAVIKGAILANTQLEQASLEGANLTEAYLEGANLKSAHLANVSLREAYLANVSLDDNTNLQGATLPDGTIWSDNVDMRKYIDPAHPSFWKPAWMN